MKSLLRALLVVGISGVACKGKPEIGFEIALPGALVKSTTWFEVGAFRDASCAALNPMLKAGIPGSSTVRVAFLRSDKVPTRLGDIPRASYAFAAVAKNADCAILATGCVEADVGDTDSVSVPMAALKSPTGACPQGASCEAAQCVPANDNANPSVGAGCSLELLGSGPLATPAPYNLSPNKSIADTVLSAPAIAATPSGFVIVYREIDPGGSAARLTILPIDPAGGAATAHRQAVAGRCGSPDDSDGVGLAMNGTDGQVVLSRAVCSAKAGLELLSFSTKPAVTADERFLLSEDVASTKRLTLSDGHVAAGNVVAFVRDGAGRISTIIPGHGVDAPTGSFAGITGITGAWAAASDNVLAVLGAGAPAADAGAPGDVGESTLYLNIEPASTTPDKFVVEDQAPHAAITFPGTFGGLAARGKRVIVMSDEIGPNPSVKYRAFDLGTPEPADENSFSVEGGSGNVTTGDVTIQGDRAYFVALRTGAIALNVYANASTTLTKLRSLDFTLEPRIPSLANVRDGRVAIAATPTRVAVVWTTAKKLLDKDSPGGYAVFACTP